MPIFWLLCPLDDIASAVAATAVLASALASKAVLASADLLVVDADPVTYKKMLDVYNRLQGTFVL